MTIAAAGPAQHTAFCPRCGTSLTGTVATARYVGGLTTGQHIKHGIATVLTAGLWAPFWALTAWLGRRRIR
jgi:hypothetical protein